MKQKTNRTAEIWWLSFIFWTILAYFIFWISFKEPVVHYRNYANRLAAFEMPQKPLPSTEGRGRGVVKALRLSVFVKKHQLRGWESPPTTSHSRSLPTIHRLKMITEFRFIPFLSLYDSASPHSASPRRSSAINVMVGRPSGSNYDIMSSIY